MVRKMGECQGEGKERRIKCVCVLEAGGRKRERDYE
jgi:hypothetical protein